MVILIPARAGSKRIPGKALKLLGGKPLVDWAMDSTEALRCALGVTVVLASESMDILNAVYRHKAYSPFDEPMSSPSPVEMWQRPAWTASDDAPDITWLHLALVKWPDEQEFMIRRPTSPFISAATIARALDDFHACPDATAMRAMRPVTEHPCKVWRRSGVWATPIAVDQKWQNGVEVWSCPTQELQHFYVQTAGLEIIRRSTLEAGSLTGDRVLPLFLDGPEALDINTEDDWTKAEAYVGSLTA